MLLCTVTDAINNFVFCTRQVTSNGFNVYLINLVSFVFRFFLIMAFTKSIIIYKYYIIMLLTFLTLHLKQLPIN